ncbi:MAG: bugT [Betaproteobacteria bacterium]|nr:bugT [Betaproteobacteria bacterium]
MPTLAEAGVKDFNTAPWQGVLAPAGTPRLVVNYLHTQIAAVLKTSEIRERFALQGTDPVGLGPKAFDEMIDHELVLNSKVIKAVGMKGD